MPDVPLNSVRNAMNLLGLFIPEQSQLGVTEIARLLGITKQSALRLLNTLTEGGFIERVPGQARYRLGMRVWEIGRNALRHGRLHERWRPIVEKLVAESGFDVRLVTYAGGDAVIIDGVDARNRMQLAVSVGDRVPLHATANGKLLLAHRPEEEIERTIRNGLARYTEATITSPDRLRSELAMIRNAGFSIDRGEWNGSLQAVAAPVLDEHGRVAFGLAMSGLAAEIQEAPIERLIRLVRQAAQAISRELGAPVSREPDRSPAFIR
jgi:DNA-binding IclR family transcriptional regulator